MTWGVKGYNARYVIPFESVNDNINSLATSSTKINRFQLIGPTYVYHRLLERKMTYTVPEIRVLTDDMGPVLLSEFIGASINSIDVCAIHARYSRTVEHWIHHLDRMGLVSEGELASVTELLRRMEKLFAEKRIQIKKAGI